MIKDKIAKKLNSFDVESSMFLLSFIYLFVAIYFWNKLNENSFFLFFVYCYGILTFFFIIPIFKKIILTSIDSSIKKEVIELEADDLLSTSFNENLFDDELKSKINFIVSELRLNSKTDFAILFLFVQHYIFEKNISNSELIRHIKCSFEFQSFSESHFSQTANNLFIWKDEKAKIKSIKEVCNHSLHYEKFKEILEKFRDINS